MALQLYNTLTRKKSEFAPLNPPKVGLYACGPTVYHYAHMGNMRAYLSWDLLVRVLARKKFKVRHVMNITDVGHLQNDSDTAEDKMEKAAREEKKSPLEIAEFYTKAFLQDLERLHIHSPDILCKASDHIPEMIKLIQKLEKKGFTYTTPNGVYFDVQKFPGYGKISGQSLDQLKAVRSSVERDPEKKHPADFRLWQLNQPHHVLQWDSPWGRGYPGWHIECSAMGMKYLGESFDIHTGGMDHIAIHHPNEIAQSEAATGKKFVNVWLHNAFMQVDKNKMSKSLKNTSTISDLVAKGFSPLAYRFWIYTGHYRSEMNFTLEALEGAQKTLEKWNEFIRRLQKYSGSSKLKSNPVLKSLIQEAKDKFDTFLDDDLNSPQAIAALSDFQRTINGLLDSESLSKSDTKQILDFLKDANSVLDVFDFDQEDVAIPAHVLKLAQDRQKAREAKDWKKSDLLRGQIEREGFAILDTKDGFDLRPISKA